MTDSIRTFSKAAHGQSRNPLGIIALFIALVYGIAALVFGMAADNLNQSERSPLIWFLVGFPILVLGVFSWLVAKHHAKLYSPRDYHSDDSFLRTITPDQQRERLNEELATVSDLPEAEIGGVPLPALPSSTAPQALSPQLPIDPKVPPPREQYRVSILLAQELALRQVAAELGLPLERQIALRTKDSDLLFDGGIVRDGVLTAVEVRVLRGRPALSTIDRAVEGGLREAKRLYSSIPSLKNTRFLLAFVYINSPPEVRVEVEKRIERERNVLTFPVDSRSYDFSELEQRFAGPAA